MGGIKVMPIKLKTTIPGPSSIALMKRREDAVARGPFHTTPLFAAKAHGPWIEDVDGNHVLDFASGIGVVNVGHSPELVTKAITDQASKFIHTSFNVVAYEGYVALCEALNKKMPGNFKKKSFLANSGAEAVENAIKIARTYTKREDIVCFEHGYHGRTYMAMTLTAKDKPYKAGFGPFNSNVYRAPFPYPYRWPSSSQPEKVSEECFSQFKDVVEKQTSANKVAAVIIEPVAGEGGFLPVPTAFAALLREYCTSKGIVLIFDEVQTGFGRTGTLFASEQMTVTPDLLVSAKGLGGGLPIAAVTGRAEIMDAPESGGIGGTFGGNPVACASALAVFKMFEDGNLIKNANSLAWTLNERLETFKNQFEIVGDVRGLGPMQAIELVKNKSSKEPNPDATKRVIKYAYENGLILMNAGTYGNVIRFLFPLSLNREELLEGLAVVENALKKE